MTSSRLFDLEPEQLELLKTLAQANENVPADQRSLIRGRRADGVLNLMHPGFPNRLLVPNDYDLQQLNALGLISAHDRGGNKGWVVEVLPAGKQFLASLDDANQSSTDAEELAAPSAVSDTPPHGPGDPKTEAMQLLERVIQDLEEGTSSLETVLRRCARAAWLLGEKESAAIFDKEIAGYRNSENPPPSYRLIRGSIQWRTIGIDQLNDPADVAARMASRAFGNASCELLVYPGIDSLSAAAKAGFWQRSQGMESQSVPDGKNVTGTLVDPIEYYPPDSFSACLKAIEQATYNWAVQWVVYLRYESRITGIWQRYRSSVDAKLEEISLTDHLRSIDQNLSSSNEQDWRNVLYGCRSVLEDVAKYLWRDERDSYDPIQGKGVDGKKRAMRVTQSDYVNRIQAYLHQKSTKGNHTKLLETEAEYLGALFIHLNRLDSHAHAGATQELAESAAIQTYVLLAELIRRTDMEPVHEWVYPASNLS